MGWIYLLIALAILTGVLVTAFVILLMGLALEVYIDRLDAKRRRVK